MTMDNGEGRPLDELESGQQDPQDWYFDLPSDAWRRQEEKNRMLRERLRSGAEQESRPSPFVLRKPAPEPKKRGGLFGFGRKKKDEEPGQAGARRLPLFDEAGEEDEEWSTERPVVPKEEPGLQLRPRERSTERDPWAGPGGGWNLGEQQFGRAADDATNRGVPFEQPQAQGPTPPAEPPPLRLRPRREEPGERRLNWDFGPGAWPGPEDAAREPENDNPEDEASIFAKMQQWAERGREEQHRKFGLPAGEHGVVEEEVDAAAAGWHTQDTPPTMPGEAPAGRVEEAPAPGEPMEPVPDTPAGGLRLAPRRREGEPGEPRRSSKWDEFFGLNRAEGEEEGGAGLSEGLAAMREWAKKKPLGEDIREIPEEFLKPFDWELEEQSPAGSASDVPEEDQFARFRVEPQQPAGDWQAEAADEARDVPEEDPFARFRGEPQQPAGDWQAEAADEAR
ncbi:hypothetical protein, partial [Tepidiforma sp.]|uniref:hypothetical protein n=1 Tax=Tepidiforma sp. TaxID=2682230 RepID=UPI002ADDF59E